MRQQRNDDHQNHWKDLYVGMIAVLLYSLYYNILSIFCQVRRDEPQVISKLKALPWGQILNFGEVLSFSVFGMYMYCKAFLRKLLPGHAAVEEYLRTEKGRSRSIQGIL